MTNKPKRLPVGYKAQISWQRRDSEPQWDGHQIPWVGGQQKRYEVTI